MGESGELLQGTLEMLVLKALSLQAMHGWGIGHRIEQMARGAFAVPQGSLYPALQRMLNKGWIRSEWRTTENNRRARYYVITRAGTRQLRAETEEWERAANAIKAILRVASAEGL
jgi:transcriptional regulator